ncbi:MAG TPA: chromosome segregation protein SMC [Candidatus Lachnoclostridium stercoripullorum]|uniref:Chromosome partition protein Smc n=1 Tax=Candidatus Lachnoclostridium stercoripullorum TaxID=2838635 RepID=A0A9D1W454_9FIRM|nr:chromosome segregation protein SMC [Candidatus Lachnoclostridium stercoripullorum]
MYLKSIEIHGFKSFANKIVFQFHNGITGIVGPNGSGKSNVADAVRWVLGEQKVKQLRGASMQDVIFAGTELRKPQGFASVAITLDNSDHKLPVDYDEVTITRRIYRSGESEYRMNGSQCRLKDINELFYDTGIGKEGYSIIGQGQIDKILSGKPEERRELFDEAAGIVKFKRRKTVAQKKLEDEKQNLVRVTDILAELEKQVGPLAKQSETAKEYLRLKEELKRCDANAFLAETAGIQTQLKELEEKETIVADQLEETSLASENLKREYDQLTEAIAALDEGLAGKREERTQAGMLMGNLEGQIGVLKEQINTERMNAEHIASRLSSIDGELEEKNLQMTGYERERDEIAAQAETCLKKQEDAEEALRRTEEEMMLLDQQIEDGKASIIANLNEKASLAARKQRYATMLEQAQVRRSEVAQRLLKFKSDESVQDEQLKAEREKLDAVEAEINRLMGERTAAEENIAGLEQEVRRLNKNLNDTQQQYHTSYTRLESLRNLAERYEGYGGSIRRVMEVRDRVKGIHGVVADIISTEKKYEVAVETALGGSIQNIVTDSEQTAKQLIEYLKKNKYGRATFLPLTSVGSRGGFNQEAALREPGIIGLADSLVHVEPQYRDLASYLLGRVVVAENIDCAIALARKFRYSLRIVTLEGELLSAGGSMTGGAFKNSSNLLGRRREIEELEAACKKALVRVDEIQKDLSLNEGLLTEERENLERLRAAGQEAILKRNTIQIGIAGLEEKKTEIAESSTDMVRENQDLEEQLREIGRSQEQLREEEERLEGQNAQTSREIERLTGELERARQDSDARRQELSGAQMETSGLHQRHQFALENIRRVREEMRRLDEEKRELSQGAGGSSQAIASREAEIGQLRELIESTGRKSAQLEEEIEKARQEKEAQTARQNTFFARREEISGEMGRLDKELLRLQNQSEKLSERMESYVNYMWSEYELTRQGAEALRDEDAPELGQLKRRLEELKSSIRSLGNVNVNAIEDYKEISERYEFMKTQHGDLVKAEEALLKIIEELDAGMRRQFEEKFREIQREFDKVFKEMFGGGSGKLELLEDEDLLEAGIQIIAQPPGKKLQNMMQLSGGEKALTAIALLFAIQNLKPSPFCLLDEIEAALDDSNVDRFAKYLHKLTKYTQFIVITHRRGTMMAADRLYGITMQEKGVSTLVSVNLIEDELEQ